MSSKSSLDTSNGFTWSQPGTLGHVSLQFGSTEAENPVAVNVLAADAEVASQRGGAAGGDGPAGDGPVATNREGL